MRALETKRDSFYLVPAMTMAISVELQPTDFEDCLYIVNVCEWMLCYVMYVD